MEVMETSFFTWNIFLSRPLTGVEDPPLEIREPYTKDYSHRNKWTHNSSVDY